MWCACRFAADARNLCVISNHDPFQLFEDQKTYSSTPWLLICPNVSPQHRWRLGLCHLYTLVPGTRQGKISPMHAANAMVGELNWLHFNGVEVWDAHAKAHVQVYVKLFFPRSDLRGMQGIVGESMTTAPAQKGADWLTNLEGSYAGGKTCYGTHHT